MTAFARITGVAYSLGGNYSFQVDVTDNGEPGTSATTTPDTYAIRDWTSTGGTYPVVAPQPSICLEPADGPP